MWGCCGWVEKSARVVWRAVARGIVEPAWGYGGWVWCLGVVEECGGGVVGCGVAWREVVRGSVSVKGYHKKNGAYVLPHT